MRTALMIIALSFGLNTTLKAEDQKATPENSFEKHKTDALKRIDERIEALGKMKSCVSAAAKPEDMETCHKDHKESMTALRTEIKDARIEKLKNRRNEMDKKIQDMNSKK